MFRKIMVLSFISFLLVPMVTGCEDQTPSVATRSLPLETASADAKEKEPDVPHSDGPSLPVYIAWQDVGIDASKGSKDLALALTNNTDEALEVQVSIEFAGLIKMIRNVDLEKLVLEKESTIDLSVEATEIPVQCPDGACQARAIATIFYHNENGDVQTYRVPSGTIYYRHLSNYSKVAVFTQQTLIEKLGGHLSGRKGNKAVDKGLAIGRVKNGKGGFDEVRSQSDELAIVVDGQVIGWETGADISIGFDTEEGN